MRKSTGGLRALCGLFLLAACSDQAPDPTTLRVGAILPLTGGASFIGLPEEAVLRALTADSAAAAHVDVDIRDSGGDPARARALLEQFAADTGIAAVIGPSTSGEALAVAGRADTLEIPLLTIAANKRIVLNAAGGTRRWVFKFAQNDDLAADRLARAMRANRDSVVAMLFSDDAFGTGGAEAFRLSLRDSIRIAVDRSYPAQLAAADPVAALVGTAPAVIVWGTTPGPPLLVKALRARGYTGRVYLSHGNASGTFLQDAGTAAEGALVVGSRVLLPSEALVAGRPADDVIRDYQALWGRIASGTPSTFGGHARDVVAALVEVGSSEVRRMTPAARRGALRDRIEGVRGLVGVTGTFSFSPTDHAGLTADAFELYRVQGGRFVAVR